MKPIIVSAAGTYKRLDNMTPCLVFELGRWVGAYSATREKSG